jgi:CheY-like chemotaxis protein
MPTELSVQLRTSAFALWHLDKARDCSIDCANGQKPRMNPLHRGADRSAHLRRVQESKPDLVILDMLLPRLGGEHVLLLLQQDRATSCLPVIVLSGLSQKNAGKLKKAGATAYIEKSKLDLTSGGENLVRVVNAVLREARPQVGVRA